MFTRIGPIVNILDLQNVTPIKWTSYITLRAVIV